MPTWFFIAIAAGLGVIIAAARYEASVNARRRLAAYLELARELNMSFDPGEPANFPFRALLPEWSRMHTVRGKNTLTGMLDVAERRTRAIAGEVRTQAGKSVHNYVYVGAVLPCAGAPRVVVTLERGADLFDLVRAQGDIDFESKEFSDTFDVRCADKRFVYDLFHPRAMELLLRFVREQRPGLFTIDLRDDEILVVTDAGVGDPNSVKPRLALVRDFLTLWPGHVDPGPPHRTPSPHLDTPERR